jgi:ribosome-binding factor A
MSRRLDRVAEACKEVLSEVIAREVKDPRIGFVTIIRVDVSPDLRHAKVYVSILGSDEEVASSLAGLESSKGYMRSALGKHLRIKRLPEIEFVLDNVSAEALRLSALMRKVAEDLEDGEDGADV